MSSDKVYVGLEHAPHAFDVCGHVLGQGGANLDFIRSETGALVILKGGVTDKMNPLHLALSHSRPDQLASARQLALSLVESVRQEFQEWCRQNQPKPAAINLPPPGIVNQAKVPVPNVISSLPPPAVVAPVLAASPQVQPQQHQPQPQFLQLIPQQQIFVAQDGSQYIKVSPGTSQNIGPVTAMPMGQNVAMQPQQIHPQQNLLQAQQSLLQAQHNFSQPQQMQPNFSVQPPPQFQIMSGVASQPTVCLAPTLSTGTAAVLNRNAGPQPWTQGPLQVMPTPVSATAVQQTNATPQLNIIPSWNQQPAQQNHTQPRPWADTKPASAPVTAQTNPENLPWYQNSQNVPTSPVKSNENKAVEAWSEGAGSVGGSGKRPGWDSTANGQHGIKRKANKDLPDLREELKSTKEETTDPAPEPRRDYRRDVRSRDGRRDRDSRRRDEPYRRPQEERPTEELQAGEQGAPEVKRDRQDTYNQVPPPQEQLQLNQNRYQQAQGRPQESSAIPFNSKWDSPNRPGAKPANAYAQNNYQQQQPRDQNASSGQYQNYGQQSSAYKPIAPPPPPPAVDEKPVPAYQVVGQPTTYAQTNPWVHQGYDQKQNYSQQQHPWNRPNAGNPSANQYGQNQGRSGPWESVPQRVAPFENRPAPFENRPAPFENQPRVTPFESQQQNYAWSGQY